MSLREKKKIETKNRIFEVSGRLFKQKGFENTTVDEIAEEAGIAKGTFFNYFPTKEALLLYFGEQMDELIYNLIENETKRSIPTKEKIKNLLVRLAESHEMDKALTKLLIFEYRRYVGYSGLRPGDDKSRSHRLIKIIHDLLEEGVKKREIKSHIEIKKASEILTAVYVHSLMVWVNTDGDFYFSRDISGKIDLLFEGIGDRIQ